MENLKVTPRPVNVAESEFTIHGTNPLLCQKLPRNRLVEDLDKWPTTLKKITDELAWQYFKANLYLDENNYVSFPAVAVKKAGEEGGRFINGLAMNKIKGLFYINGNPPHGYVNICTPDGKPLEVPEYVEDISRKLNWEDSGLQVHPFVDMIHMKRGGAIPVCFAQIDPPWQMTFKVEWSPMATNPQEVADIIENAGFYMGIGCRRTQRTGERRFGNFTLIP